MNIAQILEHTLRGKRIVVLCPAWPHLEVAMTVENVTVDLGKLRITGTSDAGVRFSRPLFFTTEIESWSKYEARQKERRR